MTVFGMAVRHAVGITAMSDVQLISKMAKLLDVLLEVETPSLKEISVAAGIPISTTSRLLTSMQQVGFVGRDEHTKLYRLGPRFLRLAASTPRRRDIAAVLRPSLETLCQRTGEDVALAELQGRIAVFIDRVDGHHALKLIDVINKPEILYVGAFRKVLLAFQTREWIDDYIASTPFARFTPQAISTAKQMWAEIRKVREQGYAVSFGERLADAAGVAAPIFDHNGSIRAAVQIAGPISRINKRTVRRFTMPVLEAAKNATEALAGHWPQTSKSRIAYGRSPNGVHSR